MKEKLFLVFLMPLLAVIIVFEDLFEGSDEDEFWNVELRKEPGK